jgi:hypothetical protein
VKPWERLQDDDCDFRSWAKGANKERLQAGYTYEFARESGPLRGLLVLVDPARKRKPFEIGGLPASGEQYNLPCSFKGLREEDARAKLRDAFRWLKDFANELAANKSFAELLRRRASDLDRCLAKQPRLKAIRLAYPFPGDYGPPPYPWQPWSWKLGFPVMQLPDRQISDDGREKLAFEFDWQNFTNDEIGQELKKWAALNRPKQAHCKEPTRRGHRPRITFQSALDSLSAMRLAAWYPKTKALRKSDKYPSGRTVIDIFREVQLGGIKPGSARRKLNEEFSYTEFDRYAARARRLFTDNFAFGEIAANWLTWEERQK